MQLQVLGYSSQRRTFVKTTSPGNPVDADERQALKNRQLPEMKLCDGSADALTAPVALDAGLSMQERAMKRFEVRGNAVSMFYQSDQHHDIYEIATSEPFHEFQTILILPSQWRHRYTRP